MSDDPLARAQALNDPAGRPRGGWLEPVRRLLARVLHPSVVRQQGATAALIEAVADLRAAQLEAARQAGEARAGIERAALVLGSTEAHLDDLRAEMERRAEAMRVRCDVLEARLAHVEALLETRR